MLEDVAVVVRVVAVLVEEGKESREVHGNQKYWAARKSESWE